MSNTTEDQVIRKLRQRATRGELSGIDVTYHVHGGSPAEHKVHEEIQLSGVGQVKARVRTGAAAMQESSETLSMPQMKELLLQIGDGADGLIPQSEARFIPDSVVGEMSVRIEGEEVTFFFLPDQGQAEQHGKVLSPRAAAVVDSLARLHKQVLHL